jgi:predicted nucleic acid-binding protein
VTRYLLDTNIFIQARNLHYGFDFCPAFWDWLIAQSKAEVVSSIDKVADELVAGDDDLADWAKARGAAFFRPPDNPVVPALARVSAWANGQAYERAAIAIFLQVADYWLVAHALAHNYTVVTHEVPSDSTRKIKIPNACVGLTIPCISPYEMLRRERARFVLGPPPGRAA